MPLGHVDAADSSKSSSLRGPSSSRRRLLHPLLKAILKWFHFNLLQQGRSEISVQQQGPSYATPSAGLRYDPVWMCGGGVSALKTWPRQMQPQSSQAIPRSCGRGQKGRVSLACLDSALNIRGKRTSGPQSPSSSTKRSGRQFAVETKHIYCFGGLKICSGYIPNGCSADYFCMVSFIPRHSNDATIFLKAVCQRSKTLSAAVVLFCHWAIRVGGRGLEVNVPCEENEEIVSKLI